MTLAHLQLILGPTNATAFHSYLTGNLGSVDNGQTYTSEHLNNFVYSTLGDPDSKKSHFKNKK